MFVCVFMKEVQVLLFLVYVSNSTYKGASKCTVYVCYFCSENGQEEICGKRN